MVWCNAYAKRAFRMKALGKIKEKLRSRICIRTTRDVRVVFIETGYIK